MRFYVAEMLSFTTISENGSLVLWFKSRVGSWQLLKSMYEPDQSTGVSNMCPQFFPCASMSGWREQDVCVGHRGKPCESYVILLVGNSSGLAELDVGSL